MKKFWKFLGVAALAVGFTPYHVEKDEETGEKKMQALLWKMTRMPKEEEKEEISISFGFNPPVRKDSEAHLFSDDLSVDYEGKECVFEDSGAGETDGQAEEAGEAPAEAPAVEKEENEEGAPIEEAATPVEA